MTGLCNLKLDFCIKTCKIPEATFAFCELKLSHGGDVRDMPTCFHLSAPSNCRSGGQTTASVPAQTAAPCNYPQPGIISGAKR